MSTAAVGPRVTLTIEISEVLYSALQIAAAMAETTVNAFIGVALRETQIAFFAETETATPECEPTPAPGSRRRGDLGALQRAVLESLHDTPMTGGVYDLREVRKAMLRSHHRPAVSRAVHRLVELGVLVSMTPTSNGFRPDVGGAECQVRYVRRGPGG